MSTLLFVLLFVSLGLATVLVAMRSGSKGPLFDPNKRSGRRSVFALMLSVVAIFGVAIPIATAIGGANDNEQAGPVELKKTKDGADPVRGRELFNPTCSQCHALKASHAVGRVGPDLDVIRPNAELVKNAIDNGRYNGRGQMPDRLYEGQDVADVAAYVAAVAGR